MLYHNICTGGTEEGYCSEQCPSIGLSWQGDFFAPALQDPAEQPHDNAVARRFGPAPEVGDTVQVAVPGVDRGKVDATTCTLVIIEVTVTKGMHVPPGKPGWRYALVDDAPGGAIAASIAELEKRLTAQAEALEKRLAEQFEAATAAFLARLAPPVQSPPPKGTQPAIPAGAPAPEGGTQPAIPAGAPAPEGGEQGAQEPLPAELNALDTELEYVDFAYFGQVPPSGLEPPPRDGDEPRLWILTGDTEWEKRLTAQAIALEKRLAEQFEAATAALLARLAPPVQPPPPKGTQPAIPAGAPAPEGGEQGAQEPLPAELDALDTELEYVDFAYFGQVPLPVWSHPHATATSLACGF
eukprot:jgi/Tetstr1/464725/TSEL_009472.t1